MKKCEIYEIEKTKEFFYLYSEIDIMELERGDSFWYEENGEREYYRFIALIYETDDYYYMILEKNIM